MTEQRAKDEAKRLQAMGYSVIYVNDYIIARIDRPDWVERLLNELVPHRTVWGLVSEADAKKAWEIRAAINDPAGRNVVYQNIYRYRISEDRMTVDPQIIDHMIRSKKDPRGYIVTPVKFGDSTNAVIKAMEAAFGANRVVSMPRQCGKTTAANAKQENEPLGVMPKRVHSKKRQLELCEAITRYVDAEMYPNVLLEWIEELKGRVISAQKFGL